MQEIVPDLPSQTSFSAGRMRTIPQKGRKEGESTEEKTSVANQSGNISVVVNTWNGKSRN